MGTISTVLFFVGLLVRVSISVTSSSLEGMDPSMASIVVKEGESAEISCTMKESNVAYFWKKGSLENSTDVASYIEGITSNNPDQPFTATENGTLIIKKVSLKDEGKYICRVTSEEISCHGEVIVFVQAALQDFQLTIEYCEPENSCVISTDSTKPTSLTCRATNVSPSMKLKWFNGSREVKDNIEENSLTKGTSREISSTIKDVFKGPSPLTCQAVDFKTRNDDGMFAHVQFSTPAATADISPGWIVTAILFIVGFVILLLIVIFITVWPKVRNGKGKQKSAERESLLTNLQTKDDELKTKSEEINKLNTNLQIKDDELKTKSEEINKLNKALLETQADKRVDESNVTSKDKEIRDKREQISKLEKSLETVTGKLLKTNEEHQKTATSQQLNLESKLLTQKDSLYRKDLEIQKLQSKLERVEEQLTKIQNREQEIISKEGKLKERETKIKRREDEMNSKQPKLHERETNVKRREDDMDLKEPKLRERETNVKIREDEMDLKEPKLRERETNVKRREDEMDLKEPTLRERETNVKKRENEVIPKEKRLAAQEAEIKKQSLDLERKSRKFRIDQMDSKDPIRLNCKLITPRTGDDSRLYTKEKGGQAEVKAKKGKFSTKDAKFHTVYPTNAKPIDLCESIADIIEHAIDGKMSCIIAHDASRREHWTTMFGPESASDAILPYAVTTIFRRTEELTSLGYKVDVTAKFKTTSAECNIPESVKNEEAVTELLKKNYGQIVHVDGTLDHFVQFDIETKLGQEARTGNLVLGTFKSILMIKECFLSEGHTNQLAEHISAISLDDRCRSVLITHLHKDKVDESKTCLAMVNEIGKKPKRGSKKKESKYERRPSIGIDEEEKS